MKKATITLSYDEEKLSALRLYLEQKGGGHPLRQNDSGQRPWLPGFAGGSGEAGSQGQESKTKGVCA